MTAKLSNATSLPMPARRTGTQSHLGRRLSFVALTSLGSIALCRKFPAAFITGTAVLSLGLYGRTITALDNKYCHATIVKSRWLLANIVLQCATAGLGAVFCYHQGHNLLLSLAQRNLPKATIAVSLLSVALQMTINTQIKTLGHMLRCQNSDCAIEKNIQKLRSVYDRGEHSLSVAQRIKDFLFRTHCLLDPKAAAGEFATPVGYRRFISLAPPTQVAILGLLPPLAICRLIHWCKEDLRKNEEAYPEPGTGSAWTRIDLNTEAVDRLYLLRQLLCCLSEDHRTGYMSTLAEHLLKLDVRKAMSKQEVVAFKSYLPLTDQLHPALKNRCCEVLSEPITKGFERLFLQRENGDAPSSAELKSLVEEMTHCYNLLATAESLHETPPASSAVFLVLDEVAKAVYSGLLTQEQAYGILYRELKAREVTRNFIMGKIQAMESELSGKTYLSWKRFQRLLASLNAQELTYADDADACSKAEAAFLEKLKVPPKKKPYKLRKSAGSSLPGPLARSDAWEYFQDCGVSMEDVEELAKVLGIHRLAEEEIQLQLRKLGLTTATDVKQKVCRNQAIPEKRWLMQKLSVYIKLGGRNDAWGYAMYTAWKLSSVCLAAIPAIHRWRSALLGAGVSLLWHLAKRRWVSLERRENEVARYMEESDHFSWVTSFFKRRHVYCFTRDRWIKTALFFRSKPVASWGQYNRDLIQSSVLTLANRPCLPSFLQAGALFQGFCLGRDLIQLTSNQLNL